MKIIMTGATGYIGKKLIQRLHEEGHEVCIAVRKKSDIASVKKWVCEVVFMEELQELYEGLNTFKPEMYINVAGFYCGTHTKEQVAELIQGNVIFETYVIDAAVQAGACRYVLNTTSMQQMSNGVNYSPMNLYAATKQAYEDILYYYYSSGAVSVINLQLFDTYGEDDTRRKVFNLVRMLDENESIDMSPGEQKMFFVHISDVVEAYMQALKLFCESCENVYVKYAVRGNETISLIDFVNIYMEQINCNKIIHWGGRPYMMNEIMDPNGYGVVLPGWKPIISYQEGARKCAEYDNYKNEAGREV